MSSSRSYRTFSRGSRFIHGRVHSTTYLYFQLLAGLDASSGRPTHEPWGLSPSWERFLSQGYVPINHQTRQGNHLVSWYRSPLLPGPNSAADVALPVRASDQLLRYVSDVGMFDATYATARELGRTLTLHSKGAASLFNWKRAHAQQLQQAEEAAFYLPFAPDYSITPDFPADVGDWFSELLSLEHVPFHYLVPREEMLPVNSLRFFTVDARWIECLLDGAFSIGRVVSADVSRAASQRDAPSIRRRTPTADSSSVRR